MNRPASRLSSFFLAPLLFLFALPATRDDDFIDWSTDRKLTWEDFQGRPEGGGDRAALSSIQIHADFSFKGSELSWKISCRFNKKKSWGKSKTDYILAHEQAHFDITEIHARKLHRRLSEYVFNKNSFQKDLQAIYENTMKEENEMQTRYDKETDHSIIRDKQLAWLETVKKELEASASFAAYQDAGN